MRDSISPRKVATALILLFVVLLAVGAIAFFGQQDPKDDRTAEMPGLLPPQQSNRSPGSTAVQPFAANQPASEADATQDDFDRFVQRVIRAADAANHDEAHREAMGLLELIKSDEPYFCPRLADSITKAVSADDIDRDLKLRRAGNLFIAFPAETTSTAYEYLLRSWELPLSDTKAAAWAEVETSPLMVRACEGIKDKPEELLCKSYVFACRTRLRKGDIDSATLFKHLVSTICGLTDRYLCDPVFSYILQDIWAHHEIAKKSNPDLARHMGVTEEHYADLLRSIRPVPDDDRFSERLKSQIRFMLSMVELLDLDEILSQLGTVTDWSEAAHLIAAYINADPQFRDLEQLLQSILNSKLDPGDMHRAMRYSYFEVSALADADTVSRFAKAVAEAELPNSDDAFFFRIMTVSDAGREFRNSQLGGAIPPIYFAPGSGVDAKKLFREWISDLPSANYGWARRALAIGHLGKIIIDSHLDTEDKFTLVSELIAGAGTMYTISQRIILWRLSRMRTNDLISHQESLLKLWDRIITSPISYHEVPKVARTQRLECFEIWRSSEYLLALFSYPDVSDKAQQALLDRYQDAMSVPPEYDHIKKHREELEVQFASMVGAGYFN